MSASESEGVSEGEWSWPPARAPSASSAAPSAPASGDELSSGAHSPAGNRRGEQRIGERRCSRKVKGEHMTGLNCSAKPTTVRKAQTQHPCST